MTPLPAPEPPATSARGVSGKIARPPRTSGRAAWHLGANAVVAVWLALFAVVSLVHPFVPMARWLLVHLLLLGAVSNAVLIWSGHFTVSVLRASDMNRGVPAALRLGCLNAGAAAVIGGMVAGMWPVVLAGGAAVAGAVLAHAAWLVRLLLRALPGRFSMTVRYYVAAAVLLPAGVTAGVLMARGGLSDDLAARLLVVHELVNVLGWVGLTVAGTLITLWPTMLRTRVADGAERAGRTALLVLLAGLAAAVAAALTGPPLPAALGVAVYAAGLVKAGIPWVREARAKTPSSFAAWSVAAGCVWLTGSLVALVGTLMAAPSWPVVAERMAWLTAPLAAGWIAQVLLGALTFLIPVVLGGGPAAVRAATAEMERGGPARLAATEAALLVWVLPVPEPVRVVCSTVLLGVLAIFLVLLVRTVARGLVARRSVAPAVHAPPPDAPDRRRVLRGVAVGIAGSPTRSGNASVGEPGHEELGGGADRECVQHGADTHAPPEQPSQGEHGDLDQSADEPDGAPGRGGRAGHQPVPGAGSEARADVDGDGQSVEEDATGQQADPDRESEVLGDEQQT